MTIANLAEMLEHISPVERRDWIKVGMAMQAEGHDVGEWTAWSSRTSGQFSAVECRQQWKSFAPGGNEHGRVTQGTIVHLARQGGYNPGEGRAPPAPPPLRIVGPARPPQESTAPRSAQRYDFDSHLQNPLSDKARAWLRSRGLSDRVIDGAGLFSTKNDFHGKTKSCVAYPYMRGGQAVNVKFRSGTKEFAMLRGCALPLYGIDSINPDWTVLVEGEMDVLAMREAGFDAVVSPPNGASSAKALARPEDADVVKAVKKWVLATDSDEHGVAFRDDAARRLGKERCMVVRWPKGCKDANDVLMAHGVDSLRQHVLDAQYIPISGIVESVPLHAEMMELHRFGPELGLLTRWESLRDHYRMVPGEMTVVTGVPSHGKSAFVDALLVHLAKAHGWRFGLFSPENQPVRDHVRRLAEIWCGFPFRDGLSWERATEQQASDAGNKVLDHFTWILPDDDEEWALDAILDLAATLVFREGIRGLVLDPFNELDIEEPRRNVNESTQISTALRKIRRFARKHDCHIWVVAHPAKMMRNKDGNYPVPSLYDISGSAAFRNRADVGIVVWRDMNKPRNPSEIHVQKVRFRDQGVPGLAQLDFESATGRFRDALTQEGD